MVYLTPPQVKAIAGIKEPFDYLVIEPDPDEPGNVLVTKWNGPISTQISIKP